LISFFSLFENQSKFFFLFSNPQMGSNTIDELLSRGDSDILIQQQEKSVEKKKLVHNRSI
jgi:hypothetical protein